MNVRELLMTPLSRRTLLRVASMMVAGLVIRPLHPAWAAARPTVTAPKGLTPDEWRTLGLLVDHVFPRTAKAPSAQDAGVIPYLRRALSDGLPGWRKNGQVGATGGGYSQLVGHYWEVVRRLDQRAKASHGKSFTGLAKADREPIVAAFATGAKADVGYHILGLPDPAHASDHHLFEMVRRHTIEGYFGEPVHGGNRNFVAWESIGHTHHAHYTETTSEHPPHTH